MLFHSVSKNESREFISSTFERKHFEKKFIYYTLLYLNITNVLRMFFSFQRVISSLPSAFREFIGEVFSLHLHTHTNTLTQAHTLICIGYDTGLSLPGNILFLWSHSLKVH